MAKYVIDSSTLTDIADAIRTQYAEDSPIAVTDMAEAILGIEGSGGSSGGESIFPFDYEITETVLLTNQNDLTIENPRGTQAYGAILFCPETIKNNVNNTIILSNIGFRSYRDGDDAQSSIYVSGNGNLDASAYSNNSLLNEEIAFFTKRNQYQENIKYRAGYKYYCIFLY